MLKIMHSETLFLFVCRFGVCTPFNKKKKSHSKTVLLCEIRWKNFTINILYFKDIMTIEKKRICFKNEKKNLNRVTRTLINHIQSNHLSKKEKCMYHDSMTSFVLLLREWMEIGIKSMQ